MAVLERLFIGAVLVGTLQMRPVLFGSAFQNKRGFALRTGLGHGFVPKGKSAFRITGATIKYLPPL